MIRQLNAENVGIGGAEMEHKVPGFQHHDALWFGAEQHLTYRPLAQALVTRFQPRRVLELGSGAGSLAYHLRDLGVPLVVTVDGNVDTRQSPFIKPEHHVIARTDEWFLLEDDEDGLKLQKFDLIVSFEHFEHILPEKFPILLTNIVAHALPGAVLVASASHQRYNDHVHCHVKEADEWHEYLAVFGWKRLDGSVMEGNCPFNVGMGSTTELIYKIGAGR